MRESKKALGDLDRLVISAPEVEVDPFDRIGKEKRSGLIMTLCVVAQFLQQEGHLPDVTGSYAPETIDQVVDRDQSFAALARWGYRGARHFSLLRSSGVAVS